MKKRDRSHETNIRISKDTHQKIRIMKKKTGYTVKTIVEKAIKLLLIQ